MAVLSGLRTKTRFWWSVHEDGPATYQEFLVRAEKHISAEEATSDQENDRFDRRDNVKSKEKDLKSEKKESPKKALEFQHPGRPRPTPSRYQGYHVLNTSLENVLMKTKGKDILKKPVPMRASSSELNQKRYCRYHRSAGHDIDDCRDLKREIESLIRLGHLKEFLA
ncbi:Retrotrans gag domain-containing protein [Abeliophyllum distichum]|uniref:Retrotrans gag domain-containing protein n=1 Tax=Abeliophyllum distichum TaxID=126358 RepID=A0ABD1QZS5_9LAMI